MNAKIGPFLAYALIISIGVIATMFALGMFPAKSTSANLNTTAVIETPAKARSHTTPTPTPAPLRILTVLPNPAAIGQFVTIGGTGFTKRGTIAIGAVTGPGGAVLNKFAISIDAIGVWFLATRLDTLESSAGRVSDDYPVTATDNAGIVGKSVGFKRTARTLTPVSSTVGTGESITFRVTGMTVNNHENPITATVTITASGGLTLPGVTVFPVSSDGSGIGTISIPVNAPLGTVTLTATDNAAALNNNATNNRIAQADITIIPGGPPKVIVLLEGPHNVISGKTAESMITTSAVDLAMAKVTFNYNPNLFSVDGVVPGPDFGGCLNVFNDDGLGSLELRLACAEAHTTGEPLWLVTTTAGVVREIQSTTLALTEVTLQNIDGQDIPATGGAYTVIILPVENPGTIFIKKVTDTPSGTGFGFTENITNPVAGNSFSLDDGQTKIFGNVVPETIYIVTEDEPTGGRRLTGLVCLDSDPDGIASTTDIVAREVTINLDRDETVTCTFTNTLPSVGGTTAFLTGAAGSSGNVALLAGGVAAVVAIAIGGGWYARRRWLPKGTG